MAEAPPTLRGDLNDEGPDTLLILLLSFLLPGAGHALIGLTRRGLAFFAIIALMFSTGLLLHGRPYYFDPDNFLSILATFGSLGSGLFDLSARFSGWSGDGASRTYEYGNAFILTAGLMNLLLVLDVWERLTSPDEDAADDAESRS